VGCFRGGKENIMSKYDPLWSYIQKKPGNSYMITFDEVKHVLGFEIDHSFLNFKKELKSYGFEIAKISLRDRTISYKKI